MYFVKYCEGKAFERIIFRSYIKDDCISYLKIYINSVYPDFTKGEYVVSDMIGTVYLTTKRLAA